MLRRFFYSKLFKDSFWAIVGNGIGNALLLISGILIARLLGANLYGEYGVVKTNMFYMAGFATFGLLYTSTRYIARYIKKDDTRVIGIIKAATKITFVFSSIMALCLLMSANLLETLLDAPGISSAFRALSIIIIFKALASTSNGILAGLSEFKHLAYSTSISGIAMFISCIPFTYLFGVYGALTALAISQFMNLSINYFYIYKACKKLQIYYISEVKTIDLLKFSFPIALQEISYALCNWAGIVLLTKLSSLNQVGLYTATAQWNAVIMVIPGMLANVVLSHLSSTEGKQQQKLIYRVLLVYFLCTIIPFLIVYILSDVIISFYGSDYSAMKTVLRLNILITIPACCSEVFKAELIAIGKTWLLFSFRMIKDILLVIFAWFLLISHHGNNGAFYYSLSVLIGTMVFFIAMVLAYRLVVKKHNCH